MSVTHMRINSNDVKLDEQDEYDIRNDVNKYLLMLDQQKANASLIFSKNAKQSQDILQILPLNERIKMTKESKVLTLWQERQLEWERIRNKLQSSIHGTKANNMTLMEAIDAYRPKIEEYDTIQAARPLRERFMAVSWAASLRDQVGSRYVTIGNIYSGIECETEKPMHPPAIVRKPTSTVQKNIDNGRTALFDPRTTEKFEGRKKAIAKEISNIRPHNLSHKNVENLVVRCEELFDWAIASAQDYFNANNDDIYNEINQQSEAVPIENISTLNVDEQLSTAALEWLTNRNVLFESTRKQHVMKTVSFKNTGSVAIEYRWERITKSTQRINQLTPVPREVQIFDERCYFECLCRTGTLLPEDIGNTTFVFKQIDVPGIFTEEWQLICTPTVSTFIDSYHDTTNNIKNDSNGIVHFRCNNVMIDETLQSRHEMKQSISKGVSINYFQDIIENCISRVRKPITQMEIDNREVNCFLQINKPLIDKILMSSVNKCLPLYITNERIREIETFVQNVIFFRYDIASRYLYLEGLHKTDDANIVGDDYLKMNHAVLSSSDRAILRGIERTHINPQALSIASNILLPEKELEVFDNVDKESVTARWDYSVQTAIDGLQTTIEQAKCIPKLEKDISRRVKIYRRNKLIEEKLLAKQKREELKAQRAFEQDDSDDENDEEDVKDDDHESDIPDEEDEEETIELPKNEILAKAEEYQAMCTGYIGQLFSPIYPMNKILDKTKNLFNEFDMMNTWKQQAELKSGLSVAPAQSSTRPGSSSTQAATASAIVEPTLMKLLSPFTSDEGKSLWENALTGPLVYDKKKKPQSTESSKSKSKATSTPVSSTIQDQSGVYYRNMYESVKSMLLKVVDDMIDQTANIMTEFSSTSFEESNISSQKFFSIGTCRQEDLVRSQIDADSQTRSSKVSSARGKISFLNISGEWFVRPNGKSVNSAFDIPEIERKKSLSYIKKLAELGSKAIVVVYESKPSLHEQNSFLSASKSIFDTYFSSLNQISSNSNHLSQLRIMYEVCYCSTIMELKYRLQQLQTQEDIPLTLETPISSNHSKKKGKKKVIIPPIIVPIFVLEDIRYPGVIPDIPELKVEDSDDSDPPIFLGEDEYQLKREREWRASGPHLVDYFIPNTYADDQMNPNIKISCYASPIAAINEIYSIASTLTPYGCVWIDSSFQVCLPTPDLSELRINQVESEEDILKRNGLILTSNRLEFNGSRLVSDRLRQLYVWIGIIVAVPNSLQYFQPTSLPTSISSSNSPTHEIIKDLLVKLFPKITLSAPRNIELTVVLGGKLRIDKFCCLHQLIDLACNIFISGELAIPFISYYYDVHFEQYKEVCEQYKGICRQLIGKARMLGTKIILPIDLHIGDEQGKFNPLSILDEQTPPDEGAFYGGDTNIYSVNNPCTITGFVFDIGNESIKNLKSILIASDLVVTWGTVGVCEFTCFQDGQRILAETASQVAYSDRTNISYLDKNKPSQNIVIGETSCEWFSRMLDSDGDYAGNLVGAGVLSYALRQSNLFSNIFGRGNSEYLQNYVVKRESLKGNDEWIYDGPLPEEDDVEE